MKLHKCPRCKKLLGPGSGYHSIDKTALNDRFCPVPVGRYHKKCCPLCRCARLCVGDCVRFAGERNSYTVMASSGRYAVCIKPFAALKTVMYTIVDFERKVRGTEDLIFGMGFSTRKKCQEALQRLVDGESEVSYRNVVALSIESVKPLGNNITSAKAMDAIRNRLAAAEANRLKVLREKNKKTSK